jgi:hypothetical protein
MNGMVIAKYVIDSEANKDYERRMVYNMAAE